MATVVSDSEIIDTVYAVSVDPRRFNDLVDIWVARIGAALDAEHGFETESLDVHLQRSMEMIDLLMSSQANQNPLPFAARGADQPRLVFDIRGNLVSCNPSARSVYDLPLGSPLEALPFDAQTHASLRKSIRKTLAETPKTDSKSNAEASLIRAVRSDNGQTLIMAMSVDAKSVEQVSLRTADLVWPERLTGILQNSFKLTLAEAEIGRQLVAGASVAEVAASRSRSVDTVRTQLRSLYAKTSTTSQTEFVRMALGLAALYPGDDEQVRQAEAVPAATLHDLSPAAPRSDQYHLFELPDGRKIDYALFGAKQGRVCLFVHDAQFGTAWTKRMAEDAARRGMTVIAPMRANWGRTDAYPPGANAYEQFAQDVVCLLEALELRDIVTLSRAIGSAYAYYIVDMAPERFAGIVGAAPGLPLHSKGDLERMMPFQQFLTGSIRHNKLILRFRVRSIEALYRRYGLKKLLHMVYRNYPNDVAALNDPIAMATMEHGIAQVSQKGMAAFYEDFKSGPEGAWDGQLQLPVPMHCLIGDGDPNDRIGRAQKLIDKGFDVKVSLVPGAGDLLLFRAPTAILDAVEGLFANEPLRMKV